MSYPALKPYRDKIDAIDDQVLALLKQRFEVVKDVIQIKTTQGIPASLQDRVDEVHDRNVETAKKIGLPEDFASKLYSFIIDYTCAHEAVIMPQDDNPEERLPTKAIG